MTPPITQLIARSHTINLWYLCRYVPAMLHARILENDEYDF